MPQVFAKKGKRIMRRSLDIRRGTIGPRHDPYGYEVYEVSENQKSTELWHCGLRGIGIKRPEDTLVTWYQDHEYALAEEEFERLTGFNEDLFVRTYYQHFYFIDPFEELYGRNE